MTVTHDLSIISLISQASILVQLVMALLATLSLVSWYWIFRKSFRIRQARTEWLRTFGVSQQALIDEQGLGFVVRSVQADYLAPARLDDALIVVTQVAMLRRASILFEQQLMRGQELLFTARVLLASIDLRRQKPVAIPASLHALLESKA